MTTAVGIVSSTISIFNFVDGLFPAPINYKSQLKIYVGLNTAPQGRQDETDNGYNDQAGSDANRYCGTTSVIFDTDNDPNYLEYKHDGDAVLNLTSSTSEYKPRTGDLLFDTHLLKNNTPSHSAIDVCESETCVGPDFVSTLEGVMYDMQTKQHMPLCAVGVLCKCFDLATTSVLLDGLFSTVEAVWKYSHIEEWNGVNAEDLICIRGLDLTQDM